VVAREIQRTDDDSFWNEFATCVIAADGGGGVRQTASGGVAMPA
jgi:hypothetical protein